jgi:hypothetical protein
MTRRSRLSGVGALAGIVAVIATPIAAWWLIGDQTFTGGRRDNLDYMYRAPHLSGRIATLAGAVALAAVVTGAAVLYMEARRRRVDSRWLGVVMLLMVSGVVLAGMDRIVTAGVVGANIGGGFAIFFGAPTVVAFAVWAVLWARHILRHPAGIDATAA